MKKYSFLFILLLQFVTLTAQIETAPTQVTRPAPTVSSMMNFAEIPVNTFTGVPDISIPLHSFPTHSKDVNINLALSYHPAGVSLLDRASDVGVGWNFMFGGVVSRTSFDEPDDFYHNRTPPYNMELGFNDEYTFSFLGKSGKFRIVRDLTNNTFTVQKLDNSTVKIEFDMNPTSLIYNSFTIYDDKGYKYFFDQIDKTTGMFQVKHPLPDGIQNQAMTYRSAFHLSKIFDNNGKELVNYTYTLYTMQSGVHPSYNNEVRKPNTIIVEGIGKVELNYQYLSSLLTSGSDPIQLNDIVIKNLNSNVIKKYVFTYIYSTVLDKQRRLLNKVSEFSNDLSSNKDYTFAYGGSSTHPSLCSEDYEFGTDGFGYLNLKPKYSEFNYFAGDSDITTPGVCEAGVLTQMTLPTGGHIDYDFESNTLPFIYNNEPAIEIERHGNLYNSLDNLTTLDYLDTPFSATAPTTTFQFTVSGTVIKQLFFKFLSSSYTSPTSDPVNTPLYPSFAITGPNTNYNFDTITTIPYNNNFPCIGKMLELGPGTYTITISKLTGTTTSGSMVVKERVVNTPLKRWTYGPGLRIKKISHFDGINGTPAREVNYDYQKFDDANTSSGEFYDGIYDGSGEKTINATINYLNVKVYDTGNNGYTKYYYKSYTEHPLDTANGYLPHYGAYKEGLLAKSEVYDNTGRLLKTNENTYDFEEIGSAFSNFTPIIEGGINTRVSWAKLTTSVNKDYCYEIGNITPKIVETIHSYTYNSTNKLIDEQTTFTSLGAGDILKTKHYYHTGNSTLSKNRTSILEKVEKYRGTTLLSTVKINFITTFSGNVSYLPETIVASKENNALETRLRYTVYDDYSNPLQVQQENGLIVSYIWGYNKSLPVAKLENIAYANIPSGLITTIQNKTDSPTATEAEKLSALDALRASTDPNMQKAMVTTFTHKPLVGISTITDPKGDKMSYIYDTFNQLKEVRDKNNNILSESEYFYRGTNTSLQNYIKNKNYKLATTTSITSPSITQALQVKTYYDGLGRTIQEATNAQSGTGKDIIKLFEYDNLGRKVREYLPFFSLQNTMAFVDNITLKSNIVTQYQTKFGDTNPFREKLLENSPLGRVLEEAAPGNDWALNNSVKHTVRFDYQTNVDNEVKLFKAVSSGTGVSGGSYTISLVNGSGSVYYPHEQLYKIITKNENWKTGDDKNNTTEEFKDKEGRVVMKRTYGISVVNEVESSVWHETYNVYDQHGNLTFVIPPLADGDITPVLDNICYQYKYDHRNRVVEKKSPGKDWEFIVYDKLDRVVAVGPAKSPFSNSTANGWLITKYDVFNRVAYTGWEEATVSSSTRATKQNVQNGLTSHSELNRTSSLYIDGIITFWNNDITPTAFKLLSVNYYDNYNFPNAPTSFSTVETQPVYYNNTTAKPIGLTTGGWIRTLSLLSDTTGESSYVLYNAKARLLRTYKTNLLGWYTQVDNIIDTFNGKVNSTITKHKRVASDSEIYIKDAFTYTDQEKLLTHTHQIGTGGIPQLLKKNSYDELGRLISKQVGGTDITNYVGLQKIDYYYNIRGWLTAINDVTDLKATTENDLFAFNVNYNNTIDNNINNTVKQLYTGNIAEITWRTKNDNIRRRYGYSYDNLNRLKKAAYQKPGINNTSLVTNSYNESMTYDKNGNIKALQRYGEYDDASYALLIDNLVYTYDTSKLNQLMKVVDNSNSTKGFKDVNNGFTDYTYDANGNLLTDQNKGVTATVYNHLNLPTKITFGSSGIIEYLYNAVGKKLKKTVIQGTDIVITDYLDGFQYEKVNTNNTTLDYFDHAEGYVKNTVVNGNNTYNYVFNYTDHLGNIRVSYGLNSSGVLSILEENNYYPYGLRHKNYNMSRSFYRNNGVDVELDPCTNCPRSFQDKYNGKSWEDELGLNIYAMDTRQYDPAIARWVVQDPVTHYSQSPYNAFDGNPVYWADPSGSDARKFIQVSWSIPSSDGETRYNFANYDEDGDGSKDDWVPIAGTNETKDKGEIDTFYIDGRQPVFADIQKAKNSLYNLFLEVLKLKNGSLVNIDDAIKDYNLDPDLKKAIKSIKVVGKNKLYVDWNSEDDINFYSFINVKDGILNVEVVKLPAENKKVWYGIKITGGNLQLDTSTTFKKGKIYNNLFLNTSGWLLGIIKEDKNKTTLTTTKYGF